MIIAERNGINLEFDNNWLMLNNNKDGQSLMDYEELSIELTKDDMLKLIELFTLELKK